MTEWNLTSKPLQVLTERIGPRTMWRLAFGSLIVAEVVMLLWVGRKEWYFFDEWRLVVERVVPHPNGLFAEFKLLFKPDGEHVIGIPLTFFVILVRWVGLDNYWPFIFVNILVRIATLLLVDDVCRRVGARRIVRLLAVACIAFFGEGYESLFAQSVMFAGFTLIFGLLAIRQSLKTDISDRHAGITSALWLSASVLSSSYGFPVVAGVALFFLLTHRRLPALVSLIVPPIVFMTVRLITGGEYAQQQPVATGRIPLYIHYVQSGLSAVGEAILGLDALGVASFVVITVASLLLVTDDRARAFVVAMLVAIVAFYFEASLSRSVFGPDQARVATRYTFFCGVLAVCMIAAAWGQRRIEKRWVPIVVVLAIVSFANNIAWLGDGSDYYTTRMEISRARLAVGFGIIDRNLTFYAPDPEFAADLTDDRLGSVIASRYDDEFMVEANKCVDHWNNELARAGIADGAIDDQQRSALLVLLNEHSLGVGPPGATLDVLVDLAAQNVGGSGILSQFQETYAGLVSAPVDSPGFVPTTQRCARG
jgi:hypothetical protein